jgi:hypothetical protein
MQNPVIIISFTETSRTLVDHCRSVFEDKQALVAVARMLSRIFLFREILYQDVSSTCLTSEQPAAYFE